MRLFAFFLLFVSQGSLALKVLTYSSFLGKGSLGAFVAEEYKKTCKSCVVEFEPVKDLSGLLGELRRRPKSFDVVLGLSERHYQVALDEKLVKRGILFEQSPVVVLADTRRIPKEKLPVSWAELVKLKKSLIVQDPRFSNTGAEWLRAIYEFELVSPKDSAELTARVYPSWSASYDAFLKGSVPFVWTYLSSQAYHLCHGEKNFSVLSLKEGFPVQKEFAAVVRAKNSPEASSFVSFLMSSKIQGAIPELNWMFPGSKKVKLPDCFIQLPRVKELSSKKKSYLEFSNWIDKWSLL